MLGDCRWSYAHCGVAGSSGIAGSNLGLNLTDKSVTVSQSSRSDRRHACAFQLLKLHGLLSRAPQLTVTVRMTVGDRVTRTGSVGQCTVASLSRRSAALSQRVSCIQNTTNLTYFKLC